MSQRRPTVLILASDPAFARELTAHWPHAGATPSFAPEFVVLDERFSSDLQASDYDLAIADAALDARREGLDGKEESKGKRNGPGLKEALVAAGRPAILIVPGPSLEFYRREEELLELRRDPETWATTAGLIGREILRRCHAEAEARAAETVSSNAEAEAMLGRYMVEMRTNLNNALTTVLGNAELLTLEPGLPSQVMAQADTIRNMALRLHEVFQRFYSLEKELTVAARESGKTAHATAGLT
jgi:hypothetical protein